MTLEKNVTPAALDIATFDLTRSAMIEASAGTGKTFTISNLVVRLLLGRGMKSPELDFSEALDIENILIVTFTNAAASDLKARILEKIRSVRIDFEKIKKGGYAQIETLDKTTRSIIEKYISESSSQKTASSYARLLKRAERAIDNAAISTIHSFCNRALNQVYTFEAGRAFNVELAVKCTDQEKQAKLDVWRELFYRNENDLDLTVLEQVLTCKSPGDLHELKVLENLRLVDSSDGYYGFSVNLGTQDNPRYEEIKISREDRSSIDKRLRKVLAFYSKSQKVSPDEIRAVYDSFVTYLPQSVTSEKTPGSLYRRNDGKEAKFGKGTGAYLQEIKDRISSQPDDLMFFYSLMNEVGLSKKFDKNHDFNEKSYLINSLPGGDKFDNFAEVSEFESSLASIVRYCQSKVKGSELVAKEIRVLVAIKIMLRTDELCQRDNLISSNEVLRQLAVSLSGGSDRALNLAGQLRSRYPVVMIDEFQDTDPVQFEVFSELYLSEQSAHDKCCCYLIGDPKQSIYSFRGSDINSYNKAKQLVISRGGNLYSLETNYRSTKNIINGVNALFTESKKEQSYLPHPFDYSGPDEQPLDSHIRFKDVAAPDDADRKVFYFEDDSAVGNYFQVVHQDKNAGSLNVCVAKATADVIVKCLSFGVIEEKGVKRRVKPSDIAVLVADKNQNGYIEKALRERNIRSVYFSDHSSVLANVEVKNGQYQQIKETAEAANIVYFMEAVCSYSQIRNVYRLLGSSLMGLNRAEYEKHINGRCFDDEITILRECRSKWEEYGFFSAFSHYAQRHDLIKKFLRRENGERALTNYFQIAEIIQSVNSKVIGSQAQLLWFKECLKSESQSTFSEDDTKKRLESEQSLVKVLTYFMSKGLQFPIVLMPYMYSDEIKDKTDICYDPGINHLVYTADRSVCMDIDGQRLPADRLIRSALWQERTRLLYVAMTRAQLANFVFFGIEHKKDKDKQDDDIQSLKTSALYSIVSSLSQKEKEGIYNLDLYRELDGASFDNNPEKYYPADETAQNESYAVSSLDGSDVDRSFRVSSYTEIASGGHNDIFRPGEDEPYAPLEIDSQSRVKDLGGFARVKGTRIGTFMHKALELLLSRDIKEHNDHDFLYEFSKETLKNDIYGIFTDTSRDYCSDLSSWLYDIIHAKLPVETAQNSYASLCSLGAKDCARELDYYLPCAHFDMNVFNRICQKFYKDVLEQFSIKAEQELPLLFKDDFSGYLTGSLDLVARFNHKGADRYYLCDYKTNYLGESRSDYSVQELVKSIFSSRYDVQILLYSVALKRFLKLNNRLDEKGESVGGVMYLYLRGMSVKDSGELSDGVVLLSPDPALVDELDRMLNV